MNFLSPRSPLALALLATICLVLAGATVTIVPETSQAVVVRGDSVVDVYNPYRAAGASGSSGAGLKLRLPVLDRIVWMDKRIQTLALTNRPLRSADEVPLQIDAVAHYRIVDPALFYRTVGNAEGFLAALRQPFGRSLQSDLGKRTLDSLLSAEQGTAPTELRTDFDRAARKYGAEIVDVRIVRTALPEGEPLQAALRRMSGAQFGKAEAIRAEGDTEAKAIIAQANADAARLYQEHFGRDVQFYDFYRAMLSYRAAFDAKAGHQTNMVLSLDNDYLRQFRGR